MSYLGEKSYCFTEFKNEVLEAIQSSAITVDSSVNVSLKTLIEQQATMPSNIDKLTNTFCDQLTHLTSILKHNVTVEQTQEVAVRPSPRNSL